MSPPTRIYSHVSAYHSIDVSDHGFIRTLSFGEHRQSSMYLDAPFDTDFEYPSYLHLALALAPDASRTLAIGLGGGTVVKRMWRDYKPMSIDVVEIDPEVVDVARRYFALPDDERIRIFVDDGRHFAETCGGTYDIVIVDAFDENRVPPQLADPGFMDALHGLLAEGGAVAYNFIGVIHGEGDGPLRALLRTLADAWRQVLVFVVDEGVDAGGGTNAVLLATDAPVTANELDARIADRVGGRVTVPAFHLFGRDLYRGPGAIE